MNATTPNTEPTRPAEEASRWWESGLAVKLSATALAAAMALTGCARTNLNTGGQDALPSQPGVSGTPRRTPTPEIGEATSIDIETICDTSAELALEDCEVLPSILDGSTYDRSEDGMVIAEVSTGGHKELGHLSEDYRAALEDALQLPLVDYVINQLGVPIVFSLEDISISNGEYRYQKDTDVAGTINIILNFQNGGTDLLPTKGALKAVLLHESAHVVYQILQAEAARNPRMKASMQGMLEACNSDLDQVAQLVKDEKSDAFTRQLKALQQALSDTQVTNKQQLTVPFSVSGKEYVASAIDQESCGVTSAETLLKQNGLSDKEYEKLVQSSQNIADQIDNLSSLVDYTFGGEFAYTTEGAALKGLAAPYQGHVYDEAGERFASGITLLLLSPEGYVKAAQTLPENRRKYNAQILMNTGLILREMNSKASRPVFSDLVKRLETASKALA